MRTCGRGWLREQCIRTNVSRRTNNACACACALRYRSTAPTDSAWIYGAGVKFTERVDDGRLRPAAELEFSAVGDNAEAATINGDVIPGVQAFNEHNGNEARQSYHGLPRNTVQPIKSPQRFVMNPMQINTRNPNGGGRGGPLPRESQAPPGALYSGE